jgi:pyruvate/2-oxoglutarate dehydrogenase complex dihydrolipoamide dehydrogenase (E3) component
VGEDMQTNIKGIYAAGDIVPGPMLAHVAQAEGEIAALRAAGKDFCRLEISSVPNAVYSGLQAASVGLTEKQAEISGEEFVVGKSFFKANGKAVAAGEDEGFVKIIADVKTRKILGAHIVGHIRYRNLTSPAEIPLKLTISHGRFTLIPPSRNQLLCQLKRSCLNSKEAGAILNPPHAAFFYICE